MDKDTIKKLHQWASWLEEVKNNIQEIESEVIEMIKREEHKQRELNPEYEAGEGWWQN